MLYAKSELGTTAVVCIEPRPYTGQTAEIPWPQMFTNLLRKPCSVTHSQFIRMLPDTIQQYVRVKELELRKESLQALTH
ncbi:hypothetical protein LQV63_31135 [Paenibacillus profundus]|uniref:Uncharacterized protein n=1 Tax=Paenibacillus profundus TaxID=1173085 RepID=A0ABS8YQT5_9BACL|nr:hypothetical protein [Paenibacillus profundus]MCE5173682.1 hypothetical protein [Paenibacillus profundus]